MGDECRRPVSIEEVPAGKPVLLFVAEASGQLAPHHQRRLAAVLELSARIEPARERRTNTRLPYS